MRDTKRLEILEARVDLLERHQETAVMEKLLALVADLLQTQTLILRHLLEDEKGTAKK